jgi:hypothetical protein
MANGGIFTIITNDGKQDRMLMATALLHDRLDRIWKYKKSLNPTAKDDDISVLPTLIDIEKTHILFTNAHFKPFAAIGFEYNKVKPTSGNVSLNSTLQFSIPQYGDFFHDIAFHCVLSQPTITNTATNASDQPAMQWCTYPGERLLKTVSQEVNGNPLDSYTLHATVAHREFRVAPNKITAWRRCVGQEQPLVGNLRQQDWANSGATPGTFQVAQYVNVGNQTPTSQKSTSLELFVPLLFWYNQDVRLAVPSVSIPYGQRFINVTLAPASELVGLVPRGASTWASPGGTLSDPTISSVELYINNIFVNPEVHKIYIKRVGFSLIRVHREQIYNMQGSTAEAEILLQQLKWPIEYLFVGAKVRDYFSPTSDADKRKYLQVWDKYSVYTDNTYTTDGQAVLKQNALLTDASIAAGHTLGITAATGVLTGTALLAAALAVGDTVQINGGIYTVAIANAAGALAGGAVNASGTSAVVTATAGIAAAAKKITVQGMEIQAKSWAATLDTINISAHGVDIYKVFPTAFFNAYTSYHYGGPNINGPQDVGSLFVPFCLYPGTYQPSGHINVSRAREFYLKYTSTYFQNNAVPGLLVILASAINFLLISDGSAVLRYST